jgi:hypothetical protein
VANGDLRLLPGEQWHISKSPDGMLIIGAHVVEGEEHDTLYYTKILTAELPDHVRDYVDQLCVKQRSELAAMLDERKARGEWPYCALDPA